mmetsp:Transcript_20510/g.44849  ORF Transcript_20510/g.44849 Transcript_20510/m.44849 type:complete len:216 (-) Transcript_20510:254-901(-)
MVFGKKKSSPKHDDADVSDDSSSDSSEGSYAESDLPPPPPPPDAVPVTRVATQPSGDEQLDAMMAEDRDIEKGGGSDLEKSAGAGGEIGSGTGAIVANEFLGPSPYPAADGQIDAPLEELEVTTTRTLKRIDEQEKKAAKKEARAAKKEARAAFCKKNQTWICLGIMVVLVLIAAILAGVLTKDKGGGGGGSEVDIPDDFDGPSTETEDPDGFRV